MKPEKASDRRPNDEPFYIDKYCECGEKLAYFDEESGWYDEFECPECEDGIHLDVPGNFIEELNRRMDEMG